MNNFDLKKYLTEGRLLKEEQMGSYTKFLKVVKSYEDEEILKDFLDSYPKGQDISKSEYDKFTEKHFGLADPEDYRGKNWKYIMSENKLLKEEIMVDTTVMVDPNNTLMSNASDEEIDYIKDNITSVPKMPVEDFIDIYDEYLDRFYGEADPLDLQIKALQIHIDKGALTREEAIEALAMLQGQDVEEFEDEFLAEGKQLNESAPGYDTRKFGESLPTMESVKAAYEAKNDIKEDEQFVGNDINANTLLNIFAEYLPFNHYHQDKTLSYDEALNMAAEFVKFTGMDSTGEDFLNHIADTEESFKR